MVRVGAGAPPRRRRAHVTGVDISDDTWAVLRSHYDDARLTEIPFVVGQYTMLSMFANSLGVVLEADYEPLPVDGVRRR